MLSTIKGFYDNGKITFAEEPPVKTKAEVIITFLTGKEKQDNIAPKKISLGLLEGKVILPDDFNDPMDDLAEYM